MTCMSWAATAAQVHAMLQMFCNQLQANKAVVFEGHSASIPPLLLSNILCLVLGGANVFWSEVHLGLHGACCL